MIDFSGEASVVWESWSIGKKDAEDRIAAWGRSIAARVEEETIQRCEMKWDISIHAPDVERLYAPPDTRDTKGDK